MAGERPQSGLPLDARIRRIYRQKPRGTRTGDGAEPPNPFSGRRRTSSTGSTNQSCSDFAAACLDISTRSTRIAPTSSRHSRIWQATTARHSLYWASTEGLTQERIPAQLPLASVVECPFRGLEPGSRSDDRRRQYRWSFPRRSRHRSGSSQASEPASRRRTFRHSILTYDDVPSRQAHPFCEPDDHQALHAAMLSMMSILSVSMRTKPRRSREMSALASLRAATPQAIGFGN